MGTEQKYSSFLMILMYHRAFHGKYGNSIELLDKHFAYINQNYKTIYPGEALKSFKLNLCLTFDDATFDFYHCIYPLLKKYQLKALVGVPTGFIQDRSKMNSDERLHLLKSFSFRENPSADAFCSWEELNEMVRSGFIQLASHSHTHRNFLSLDNDAIDEECLKSQGLLQTKAKTLPNTLIYPYGGYNQDLNQIVKKYYPYPMRIGSGLNFSWNQTTFCRVSADRMKTHKTPFILKNLCFYLLKSLSRHLFFFQK